ncbi:MAG TPA: F0F1 ATP synthase subunit delta [Nocardioidaceae bacterium]|nr:F0F1 ATP synthase subunit delta [Nocardioidaceae bacterium]
MRGVSAQSQTTVIDRLEAAIGSDAEPAAVGSDLFAVATLLDSEPGLRRAVTDASTPAEARASMVRGLLHGKVPDVTVDISAAAAAERWSAPRDLGDTLEHAGVIAHIVAAERAGQGDELEDELFRFGRVVAGDARLREVISDRTAPTAAKQSLVRSLLDGQACAPTVRLAEQAVVGRHRSFDAALEYFTKVAADRRERFVATVRSAAPLSEPAKSRLADALQRQYGRQVHVNTVVDPELLGGLRVEIGDEVIDGTVASKLDEARRRLTG